MALFLVPDDEVDRMTVGQLAERAAQLLAQAGPARRIDLYRPVVLDGRTMHVRVKITLPFSDTPPG